MLKTILVLIIICEIIGMAASDIRSFVLSMMFYIQLSNLAGMLSALTAGIMQKCTETHKITTLSVISCCISHCFHFERVHSYAIFWV